VQNPPNFRAIVEMSPGAPNARSANLQIGPLSLRSFSPRTSFVPLFPLACFLLCPLRAPASMFSALSFFFGLLTVPC
jgi:hypothetical protein